MKKIIFTLFILIGLSGNAQFKFAELKPRKNIFVELGGNGMAFNVTYETRTHTSSDGFGIKVGAGGFSSSFENIFTFPVQANWLLSSDNKHFFEAGIGATYLYYEDKNYWGWSGYTPYPADVVNLTIDNKNSVYGTLTLGYRNQPAKGGLTWGAAITPHFNQNGFWPIWFGFKFGYSIAKKSDKN